jgi:hypothetical protein
MAHEQEQQRFRRASPVCTILTRAVATPNDLRERATARGAQSLEDLKDPGTSAWPWLPRGCVDTGVMDGCDTKKTLERQVTW